MSEPPSTGRIPDWDGLGFGIVETDAVYLAQGQHEQDPVWDDGGYGPWAPLSLQQVQRGERDDEFGWTTEVPW